MLHGGDIAEIARQTGKNVGELLDYSANINPLGMPKTVKQAMIEALSQAVHYPDPRCRALTEAIAFRDGVTPDWIVCGNGAADLIYRICYGLRPKKALLFEPAFLEYTEALNQAGCKIIQYRLNNNYHMPDVEEDVIKEADLIFLCNPNNPTGLLTDLQIMKQIVKKAKKYDTMVVVDECFLDFVKDYSNFSAIGELREYPNLIILKSFTKMYALAGVRLGYLLCSNEGLRMRIRMAGQTWSVNSLAQAAGIAALKESEFVKETVDLIADESAWLVGELRRLGFSVLEGKANYLLFLSEKELDLYELMLSRGIIIRKCGNYPFLTKNHYRIAVKKHTDNIKLIRKLEEVLWVGQEEEWQQK